MTSQSTSTTSGDLIVEDRTCSNCGYDVKGLRVGGVCPECGVTITYRRRAHTAEGVMGEAPKSYLYPLLLGLVLMAIASAALPLVAVAWPRMQVLRLLGEMGVQLGAASLWLGGLLITMRRRPLAGLREDANIRAIEWIVLRRAAFGTQLTWLVAPVVGWMSVTQSSEALDWLTMGLVFVGVAGWPLVAWHLSFLADWAGDTHIANRLRGAGIILGFGSLVMGGMYLLGWFDSQFIFILYLIAVALALIWALSYVLMLVSIAQMALMVRWARVNQLEAEARDRRLVEKAQDELERATKHMEEHAPPEPDAQLLGEIERAQDNPHHASPEGERLFSKDMPHIESHGDGSPYDLED